MTDFAIVDAFTTTPFMGNAAAVVLLDAFPEDAVLQLVAAQMNLSETAFVVKARHPERSEGSISSSPDPSASPQDDKTEYDLRWFTPTIEVNLCGHATLAAAHILHQTGRIKSGDMVTFHTLSGELRARVLEKTVELDFPLLAGEKAKPPAALKALNVDILACERNRDNYLVEVTDFAALTACKPNFKKLAKMDMQGVIVTTATGIAGYDFASRYFAPNCGIDEDPVTGSAHCFLAPYWAKKLSKLRFHALQASKGEGILDVTIKGQRVLIAGNAVTTLKGQLQWPKIKGKAA